MQDTTTTTLHPPTPPVAATLPTAPVPVELGGAGTTSTGAVLFAAARLARDDAATAVGLNAHLTVVLDLVRSWQVASARRDAVARQVTGGRRVAGAREAARRAARLAGDLRRVAEDGVVFAAVVGEPGAPGPARPATTAVRTDGGWIVRGQGVFVTTVPGATVIGVPVTYEDGDCILHEGLALVPLAAAGVRFGVGGGDAAGLRAATSSARSLSVAVSFDGVRLGPDQVHEGSPAGDVPGAHHERFLTSAALHAAASLGIAESAHDRLLARDQSRAGGAVHDQHASERLAESAADLTTMRATLHRVGGLVDDLRATSLAGGIGRVELQAVVAQVEAARVHLDEVCTRVVDRSLAPRWS